MALATSLKASMTSLGPWTSWSCTATTVTPELYRSRMDCRSSLAVFWISSLPEVSTESMVLLPMTSRIGRLGRGLHRQPRILDAEEPLAGLADLKLNDELHVHDVVVARKHEGFLGHGLVLEGSVLLLPNGLIADFHLLDFSHLRRLHAFHRKGDVVMWARPGGAVIGAETLHHADLTRFGRCRYPKVSIRPPQSALSTSAPPGTRKLIIG